MNEEQSETASLRATIDRLTRERDEALTTLKTEREILQNPVAVRLNIMRGTILLPDDYGELTFLRRRETEIRDKAVELAIYAKTVRTDRRDETREFALQTVDWCEGLIEYADAVAALSAPQVATQPSQE